MAKGLTEKQRKILEYIIDFQKDNGFPPTIRELGDAFSIGSLRGVTVHLDALVRKGHMTREKNASRSIRVTSSDPRVETKPAQVETSIRLPLVRTLGVDSLGTKTAVEGQIERYLALPEEIAASATESGFVIRVGASGVYNEPILPGDLLVVRPQQSAFPGELVVVLNHGDLVVTRATGRDLGEVGLPTPNTPGVSPATNTGPVLPGTPEIIGRVVGQIRRY